MTLDPKSELTRQWLRVAADDLGLAELANAADPPMLSGVVYHYQQAFEKMLKGSWSGTVSRCRARMRCLTSSSCASSSTRISPRLRLRPPRPIRTARPSAIRHSPPARRIWTHSRPWTPRATPRHSFSLGFHPPSGHNTCRFRTYPELRHEASRRGSRRRCQTPGAAHALCPTRGRSSGTRRPGKRGEGQMSGPPRADAACISPRISRRLLQAWRRTASGWYFGVGGVHTLEQRWQYDGPIAPSQFPSEKAQGWINVTTKSASPEWAKSDEPPTQVKGPNVGWPIFAVGAGEGAVG
jgi:hypothetical protein